MYDKLEPWSSLVSSCLMSYVPLGPHDDLLTLFYDKLLPLGPFNGPLTPNV